MVAPGDTNLAPPFLPHPSPLELGPSRSTHKLTGSHAGCSSDRLTNDGNAILREIEVAHPAAKSMIELSRTQDEEVGDGTTSVIILGKHHQAHKGIPVIVNDN